jgi:hypothetical protein
MHMVENTLHIGLSFPCLEVIFEGHAKGESGSKSTNYYFMGKLLRRLRNIVFLSLFLGEKHGSRKWLHILYFFLERKVDLESTNIILL